MRYAAAILVVLFLAVPLPALAQDPLVPPTPTLAPTPPPLGAAVPPVGEVLAQATATSGDPIGMWVLALALLAAAFELLWIFAARRGR